MLTLSDLQQLAQDTGFPDPGLAAAIAKAESGGNPSAIGDAGNSIGLWQIDTLYHSQYSKSDLTDPNFNAQAAFAISSGGTNWRPWSTAWEDAKRQIGYLGPSAPFQQYYQSGLQILSTGQALLLTGSALFLAWLAAATMSPSLLPPSLRLSPRSLRYA